MTDTPSRIVFKVPGKAAPQGSKNAIPFHVGGKIRVNLVESSKEVGPWRERVVDFAKYAMRDRFPIPRGEPVSVTMVFLLPRPTSTPKTKTPPAVKKPDLDKLQRAILDALTGVCFDDDSQVVNLVGRKRLAGLDELPGVTISVERWVDPRA